MINHQFVPQDIDDEYCEVTGCDRHISKHANIEGITSEDEVYEFGTDARELFRRYVYDEPEW